MIGAVIIGALLACLAWFGLGAWQIGRVSQGAVIPKRDGTALLLIDLQTVFWRDGPYSDAVKAQVEQTVLAEVAAATQAGWPVIAVRQVWSKPATKFVARLAMKGAALEGRPGTELAAPFAHLATHELTKRVQDAFETGELDDLLAKLDIGHLRLVGLDGAYCVARTAEAALQRGYAVTLVEAGIATAGPRGFAPVAASLAGQGAQVA